MLRLLMIAAIVLSVVSGIGYLYYVDSQAKIADLNAQVGAHKVEMEALNQSVTSLRRDADDLKRNTDAFNSQLNVIRAEAQRQAETLAKHDFGKLGAAHPALLEKRINAGTKRLFDSLETMSK